VELGANIALGGASAVLVVALAWGVGSGSPAPRSSPLHALAAASVGPPLEMTAVDLVPAGGEIPAAVSTNEALLMATLRGLKDSAPAQAIRLAREGNRRFTDSASAPERTSILIHALAAEGASSEARGEAEQMVNHFPDSLWVQEIERFSGAHRHRNIRVNDAGGLEFY
jgi:hypothetical protein